MIGVDQQMRVTVLEEPEVEFGGGRHIDMRFGLADYGPVDSGASLAPREIRVGLVGTAETTGGIREWLEKCAAGVAAKASAHPHLFCPFPGFGADSPFAAKLVFSTRLERTIQERDIVNLARHGKTRLIEEAVELFVDETRYLVEAGNPDLIICAVPQSLLDLMAPDETAVAAEVEADESEQTETHGHEAVPDFHHLLKARAMEFRTPLQLVQPGTYLQRPRRPLERPLQDEATRAWNFFTALYYKAGGTPWRLPRDPSALTSCYVGISFYLARDAETLATSVAQVFNERGDGVVLRGGPATISRDDRSPHLSESDAGHLLAEALALYRREHKTLPARVLAFKSSRHSEGEIRGFREAADRLNVELLDLVSVGASRTRLFRFGAYPVLRGTLLVPERRRAVLYTRGSVEFFATYPGMYVPRPLSLRVDSGDVSPETLATETLRLTKLNWNNTQFDGAQPITIRAARQVGDVLKYVTAGTRVEPRYAHYM